MPTRGLTARLWERGFEKARNRKVKREEVRFCNDAFDKNSDISPNLGLLSLLAAQYP